VSVFKNLDHDEAKFVFFIDSFGGWLCDCETAELEKVEQWLSLSQQSVYTLLHT